MSRLPILLVLVLPVAATAQAQPIPRIDMSAAGQPGEPGATGEGTASVSGKIVLPPGWTLSIHTLTIRYAKNSGPTTLNTLLPVVGLEFKTKINLKSGSYRVWAVIDVKDADGKERQISSDSTNVTVP